MNKISFDIVSNEEDGSTYVSEVLPLPGILKEGVYFQIDISSVVFRPDEEGPEVLGRIHGSVYSADGSESIELYDSYLREGEFEAYVTNLSFYYNEMLLMNGEYDSFSELMSICIIVH